MNRLLSVFIALVALTASASVSEIDSVAMYHESTAKNSGKIQQELVYLHLDNTSYYRGDRIYFACYLMTSGRLCPSDLSRTVYVELLNPGGKMIDRCTLKAIDGRCHGSLLVEETPFYSGYYEIRAYTKYMLNFGPEAIYSRVLPVYLAPQTEGDWAQRSMLDYDEGSLPFNRPKPAKTKSVNAKFYPEGGSLVRGLPAKVALELTDEARRPAQGQIRIIGPDGNEVASLAVDHMGRGSFSFIPNGGKYVAEFEVGGKGYKTDLPEVKPDGIALAVDNLSDSRSVEICVSRTDGFSAKTIGVSVTCRGELYSRAILDLSDDNSAAFHIPRSKLPTGVIQVTLFNSQGTPVADRLFFNNRNDFIRFNCRSSKAEYSAYEPVDLELKLSQAVPFSLSVTDGDNQLPDGADMMAELLLSSEIKGYVHNPAWYFADASDVGRRLALDNLLLVQGWRKYSWSELAGMSPICLDSLPEQGIEIKGSVLGRYRDRPKANIEIAAMLAEIATGQDALSDSVSGVIMASLRTDDKGRFSLNPDISGKWMLSVSAPGEKKLTGHRILLNRSFQPSPRAYDVGEMTVAPADNSRKAATSKLIDADDSERELIEAMERHGVRLLKEVEVSAQGGHAEDVRQYLENSTVSYDIALARNVLQDQGKKYIRKLRDVLPLIDTNFTHDTIGALYRGREPLYVLEGDLGTNGKVLEFSDIDISNPADIPIDMIKSVYVNEQPKAIAEYAMKYFEERADLIEDQHIMRAGKGDSPQKDVIIVNGEEIRPPSASAIRDVKNRDYRSAVYRSSAYDRYSCVVFLELNGNVRNSIRPGMRRMILEGYTNVVDFYSPDYSETPPAETDHRRTLYWNPDVRPDSAGLARIRFFNNGTARRFSVSAAALAPDGTLGSGRFDF